MTPLVIAIDGPAAAGKGTLARRLAAHFGLPHLDTGLLYRAVARLVIEAGGDPADPAAAEIVARGLLPMPRDQCRVDRSIHPRRQRFGLAWCRSAAAIDEPGTMIQVELGWVFRMGGHGRGDLS
jgi:hypothetical protein